MEITEKENLDSKYGSRGNTNTALGLGIAGTALGLWGLHKGGLFGNNLSSNNGVPTPFESWQKESEDNIALTRAIYDGRIQDIREKNEMRSLDEQEKFQLYKNQRDNFDSLSARISAIETKQAVDAAVEPWRAKVLEMQINGVNNSAQSAVALEAERRNCADNKMVNYMNSTFYPIEVTNIELGTTSTQKQTYNPLNNCQCNR